MRPDTALALLREHDPVDDATLTPAARDELRRRILAEPPTPPRGRSRARLRVALVAGAILLALSGSAIAIFDSLNTPDGYREEFWEATKRVPAPPGFRWTAPPPSADTLYPRDAGFFTALDQANCGWLAAWDRAYRSGDGGARRRAERGLGRIIGLMPRRRLGASEQAGGYDATSFRWRRQVLARARAGDPAGVRADWWANCSPVSPEGGAGQPVRPIPRR